MNVDEVRMKFSTPVTVDEYDGCSDGKYCVLGAAIMFHLKAEPLTTSGNLRFPDVATASDILGLSWVDIEAIADLNDEREFEAAWYALGLATQGIGVFYATEDSEDF